MTIKPEEISSVLKQQLANFSTKVETYEAGVVLSVGDGIAREFKWLSFGDRVVCADRMGFDDAGNLWTAPTPLRTAPP